MKKKMIIVIVSIVALFGVIIAFMASKKISPIGLNLHTAVYSVDKVALGGYDVVAYFQGEPQLGDARYASNYQNVDWYFSSKENQSRFEKEPETFLPQFGGYCSKAVSTGFTAPVDPSVFSIHENKLYLFSSEEVQKEFVKDPQGMINSCERKWK